MSNDTLQQDNATFEVTLKVTYDLDGESPDLLRKQLDYAIRRLAGDGLLSGDTMATVDEWSYRITEGQADTPPDGESATVRDQLADLARSMLAALKKRQGVKAHLADVQEALAQAVGLGTWRTIAALKGQAVAAQALPETPLAPVQALLDAAQRVVNMADDTGCSDDLTVTSAEAVSALSEALRDAPHLRRAPAPKARTAMLPEPAELMLVQLDNHDEVLFLGPEMLATYEYGQDDCDLTSLSERLAEVLQVPRHRVQLVQPAACDWIFGDVYLPARLKLIQAQLAHCGYGMDVDPGAIPGETHVLYKLASDGQTRVDLDDDEAVPAHIMALAREWSECLEVLDARPDQADSQG